MLYHDLHSLPIIFLINDNPQNKRKKARFSLSVQRASVLRFA